MYDTPLDRYQRDLQNDGFLKDSAQQRGVERLQQLFDELVELHRPRRSPWFARMPWRARPEHPKGVYLWGGVGRGKTYLMDVFLTRLKGEKNPLDKVAAALAEEAQVICFDEFFVADITDAMILGNLLKALFERGVTLVATSNIEPDGLYQDGLQRARFLPAIHLLNHHMDVLNIDGGVDYRLRALVKADLFHYPLNDAAEQALRACFHRLVPDSSAIRQSVTLEVEERDIRARFAADDVVWFDFASLCDGPRSQNDYIVLAREYHAVLVSGVPQFVGKNDDQARRFIYLVDEFYDRRVKLVLSAASPIASLYTQGRLEFEFQRTVSRLLEMQSEEYLAQPHRL
jgi:cell division protein ZapE